MPVSLRINYQGGREEKIVTLTRILTKSKRLVTNAVGITKLIMTESILPKTLETIIMKSRLSAITFAALTLKI